MATNFINLEDETNELEDCEGGSSANETPMETENCESTKMKTSSSLQLILASIAQERNKEFQPQKLISEADGGFVLVARDSFWTNLFEQYFILAPADEQKDDMLFYVRKSTAKSRLQIPQTEIEVYRKSSKNQPSLDEIDIDWEETVYLNLILQHFEYHVTVCVCSRTGDQELQILSKCTQKVYASPSRREMSSKGTEEIITYPNIFFTVDNFEEAFGDLMVRDSEMVCVELVARDRHGPFQGVIFLGSIRYAALKQVYDKRTSMSSKMAQRMSMGWFKGHKRVEYMRMRGPHGKGHAEMAISRVKGSGPDTPAQTPTQEELPDFDVDDFEAQDGSFDKRRMSDPNQSWSGFWKGGSFRGRGIRKSRSETENVDNIGGAGCTEVEAHEIEDEFDETAMHYNGFFGKSFGQAWGWFKDKRRMNCVALHSFLTYVTLPWHRIIGDVLDQHQEPLLNFD